MAHVTAHPLQLGCGPVARKKPEIFSSDKNFTLASLENNNTLTFLTRLYFFLQKSECGMTRVLILDLIQNPKLKG